MFNDDERVDRPGTIARGNQVMGGFVRLKDGLRYGFVKDLIFDRSGNVKALIVSPDSRYGYGYFAYP